MVRRTPKPEFAVIGLGRFGTSLALTLVKNGYTVLGIDRDRELVQGLADEITQAVALDSTDEDALREVDITSFDTVVVAISGDFESNLMTTVSLKDLGVRRVICKALDERQRSILLKIGADSVVLPEHEAGQRLADTLTMPITLGQLAVGSDHSITELSAPVSLAGRTLREADLFGRFGVNVLAIKRDQEPVVCPSPEYVIALDDLLVVIGPNDRQQALMNLN
jgi:trk system potassium uptake protein TrkA